MAETPTRLAVDANGFVWRVYDEHWSMAPVNPDNSPVPEPVTFYAPLDLAPEEGVVSQTVTTAETVTFEYDEEGRIARQVTETVMRSEERE